ncbi:MAG: hypothetical protein HQL89_05785 [Magnetococcales bacterium]|nr:hypothetical protein [Magnetococcales bacterium]
MSVFQDLPPSQQASLLELRDRTTYLWPEIQQICRVEGTSLTCHIRAKTLNQVERALDDLRNAGFFEFRKFTNDHGDQPQLYRLQMQDISAQFKEIVNSMDAGKSASSSSSSRSRGLISKIKDLFSSI